MSLDIEITPRADRQIKETFLFMAEQNFDTALDFYHAVYQSFDRIAEFPNVGVEREYIQSRLRGLRMWFVDGYKKYLIFYQVTEYTVT